MVPVKRKRLHDTSTTSATSPPPSADQPTRRATRQAAAIAPLPEPPPDPEPRRRRPRTSAEGSADGVYPEESRGKPGKKILPPIPPASAAGTRTVAIMATAPEKRKTAQQGIAIRDVPKKTRTTRHSGGSPPDTNGLQQTAKPEPFSKAPAVHTRAISPPANARQPARTNAAPQRQAPPAQAQRQTHRQGQISARIHPIIRSPRQLAHKPVEASPRRIGTNPDRNIDKVVLGNICFRAWYPSYYGKEVLGDISGNSSKTPVTSDGNDGGKSDGGKALSRRDRDHHPMLDRLYVCPCCFKYSKELVTWWEHVQVCERRGYIPGHRVYVHPRGQRTIQVPVGGAAVTATTISKSGRKKKGDSGIKTVERVIHDEGEWGIWEVNGEKEMLFCQNLSLFAKLFLDNKSVFFDVTGFKYFLLVYTPPPVPSADGDLSDNMPRHRIVGFFSKEKLSWDNNNLACILIFPPWQRKGLGSILMGVSYEISRREGILGGPEKPISDLGKKGYKRFWAGEVARWLLTLEPAPTAAHAVADGETYEAPETPKAPEAHDSGEVLVDVEECSRATWIAPEDCLLVLREMGVAEDAGMGPPKGEASGKHAEEEEQGSESGGAAITTTVRKDVRRVRISRDAVQRWATAHHINLEQTCDPAGFVEGYAIKQGIPDKEREKEA